MAPSLFEQLHAVLGPEYRGLINKVVWHAYQVGRWSGAEDERVKRLHIDAYQQGRMDEREALAALQREQVRIAREAASGIPWSDLCELRGDHERAARARAHEERTASLPSPTEVGRWVA